MFGAILKVTNSSFQKAMPCCRSIYVKKVMKLLAFIFEQPSYHKSDITPSIKIDKPLVVSLQRRVYGKIRAFSRQITRFQKSFRVI